MIRPERTIPEIEDWHQKFQQVRLNWIEWLETNASANYSFEEAWKKFMAGQPMLQTGGPPNGPGAREAVLNPLNF